MKEGWIYKKLGEVCCKSCNIKWDVVSETATYKYIDLTSVDRSDLCIHNPLTISKADAPSRAKQIVELGDVIFATTRPTLRRVSMIGDGFDGAICSTGFCVLRPNKDDITSKWIFYGLQNNGFYNYIEPLQTGASYPAVTDSIVKAYILPVPSLSEQKRIVERLDAAFAHIDELKANAEKQLTEARALFQKCLTKAMEPKEGWEEKKLKDVADFVRGPFGGSLTKSMFKPTGYAVYEQQHAIHGHLNIRYFIDSKKFKEMERFSVEAGDLIMSCSGVTLGRVNLLPSDTPVGIINQALLKMRVKDETDARFFKCWLESAHFQDLLKDYSGGAAIPNVPAVKILKDIFISIPSLSEQQRIVARLDSLSENVRKYEEVQRKVISECDALKQALLRKVFE